MHYRLFGKTGLYISELCFGTMTIGGKGFRDVIGKLSASEALIGTALDAASALPPEYPGWMVTRQDRDRRPTTEVKVEARKAA